MGNLWAQIMVGASVISITVLGSQRQSVPWLFVGCFLVWILSIVYLIAYNVALFHKYLVPSMVFDMLLYTTILLSLGLPPAESFLLLPGIITLGILFAHVGYCSLESVDAWLSRRYHDHDHDHDLGHGHQLGMEMGHQGHQGHQVQGGEEGQDGQDGGA